MSIQVTLPAGTSAATVSAPFGAIGPAAIAQNDLSQDAGLILGALEIVTIFPGGNATLPSVSQSTAVAASVPTASNLGIIPDHYTLLFNANPALTTAIGGANTALVVSSANASFAYNNQITGATIDLGGGINAFSEAFANSSATINLDGGAALGTAAAIVDLSRGATTVNAFANAFVDVVGGNGRVVAVGGEVAIEISAGSGGGADHQLRTGRHTDRPVARRLISDH